MTASSGTALCLPDCGRDTPLNSAGSWRREEGRRRRGEVEAEER